jgi:hypothetical protein
MSTPNGSVYRVVPWGDLRHKLKELHRRAKDKSHASSVRSAFRSIVAHLRTEPLRFGEPRYNLHYLDLEVRVGAVAPLWVQYAVHKERRVVFVRDIQPLPGSGF